MLDRAAISALVPHAGPMVLLDHVVRYDDESILCSATSHRRDDNPLRRHGLLRAVCGAEYGAQAAAVHGPLAAETPARAGQVVLLRDLSWQVADLGAVAEPLMIHASRVHADSRSTAYRFTITADGRDVMQGECGIMFR
jgi:predicted hotdog family 3-hydroxylacyl-ACP dehydratase